MRKTPLRPLPRIQAHATRRSRPSAIEPVSHDDSGWLITVSDLTLLLLCFLVVWYVKQQQRDAIAQIVKSAGHAAYESSASNEILSVSREAEEWQALRDEIAQFIVDAGMRGDVEIKAAADEIVISFRDSIPFASGKADLNAEALPVLEKVAAVAVSRPAMYLKVNGHTDDRPISTLEFPSNWELSSARASRVARHLIERGVHPARIEVHGFAYHRPRAANENQSGRGANRRVEISLLRSSDARSGSTSSP